MIVYEPFILIFIVIIILVELVNSQVMLRGCETSGYVIVSAAKAKILQRLHMPVWKDRSLVSKTSWVGSFECMQVRLLCCFIFFHFIFYFWLFFSLLYKLVLKIYFVCSIVVHQISQKLINVF